MGSVWVLNLGGNVVASWQAWVSLVDPARRMKTVLGWLVGWPDTVEGGGGASNTEL